MRHHARRDALGGALAGLLVVLPFTQSASAAGDGPSSTAREIASGAPTSSTHAEPHAQATTSAPRPGRVRYAIPTWTLKDVEHDTTVRVRYPSGDPRADWDHEPVRIQVRADGGAWTTVGKAKQKPLPHKSGSRTRVTYRLPIEGKIQIRAKAHSTDSSITSKTRKLLVTTMPAFAPTAIRGSGSACGEPVVGRGPTQLGYGCPVGEYGYNSWLYNRKADTRERLAWRTAHAEFATGAEVVIGERRDYWDDPYWYNRVRRFDLATNKSGWVAFKRNGKRAQTASHSSVSANGNRIAYASPNRGISPKAKKGWNVYVARAGVQQSRYVGRGKESDIAAGGRYVAWRTTAGRLRVRDLRTDRWTPVTKRKGHDPKHISVSAGGRYVTFSATVRGERRVRLFDAKASKLRTIAIGQAPSLSENGRYIAYTGKGGAGLYLWDRKTQRKRLLTVGPSGNGAQAHLRQPDISPNGRWIVATTQSINVAPDNGRGWRAKNKVILFDRKRG
ncbi:TolB family protein [Solicola gregarius]|uniref:F5/8 type C domain-containing protein n=1 Tax=Solicola gregarius TaxID=2908642 RepID=A0AA46YLF6_9ACTN|nr:hypothetical protein [Solicola gregarius]UYM06885.1 hypothetical protein L0C25_07365 [Solicola gregarius]